jgi:hypothetical protein
VARDFTAAIEISRRQALLAEVRNVLDIIAAPGTKPLLPVHDVVAAKMPTTLSTSSGCTSPMMTSCETESAASHVFLSSLLPVWEAPPRRHPPQPVVAATTCTSRHRRQPQTRHMKRNRAARPRRHSGERDRGAQHALQNYVRIFIMTYTTYRVE